MTQPHPEIAAAAAHERVDHNMTLHPPKHPYIGTVMDEIRAEGRTLAHLLIDRCPPGRELSQALTDIEDGVQHAIGAVARNQDAVLERDGVIVPPDTNS